VAHGFAAGALPLAHAARSSLLAPPPRRGRRLAGRRWPGDL